jgi:pimeloyl-ACP methyl ester carboxylesterase
MRTSRRLGIAVLRFHYRFTGNSDGDERDLTFGSMREDALASYERLLAEFPSVPGFIAGTRWGALIAASAAREHPDASVALWEPLLESARFFKDAFRRQLLRDVRQGIDAPTSGHELEERLLAGEAVDVVAHRLEASFYRSALGRSLEEELGPVPRRVLVLQISSTGDLRPDLQRLVARWVDAGFHVDAEARRGDTTAWLTDDRHGDPVARTLTGDVIDRTAGWVSDQVVGAEA